MKRYAYIGVGIIILILIRTHCLWAGQWGTGALMVIIERENSSVVVVDSLRHEILGRIPDLGVLHLVGTGQPTQLLLFTGRALCLFGFARRLAQQA